MVDVQSQRNPKLISLLCNSCRIPGPTTVMMANTLQASVHINPNSGDKHQRFILVCTVNATGWREQCMILVLFKLGMWHGFNAVLCMCVHYRKAARGDLYLPLAWVALWHSPQSRSCRNSVGLLELCVLYRVEHSRPRTQNRLCMPNTALWRTCESAAREAFQFPCSIYSRCVLNILGSQLLLLILSSMSIILAKPAGH